MPLRNEYATLGLVGPFGESDNATAIAAVVAPWLMSDVSSASFDE